jgi:hypothetical protein
VIGWINMQSRLIGFYLIAVAAMLCAIGVYLFRFRQLLHIRAILSHLRERVTSFSNRRSILADRASDYFVSLGAAGVQELNEINHILTAVNHLIDEAECLTTYGDETSLTVAQTLLEYRYNSIMWSFRADSRLNYPDPMWDLKCEKLIQSVGQRIVAASLSAEEVHVPKMRKRHLSTVSELNKIDIQAAMAIVRSRDAPVRSIVTKTTRR